MTLERDVAVVLSLLDVDARFSRWVWRKNREQMSFWYRKDILSPLHDEWTRLSLAAVRLPFKDTHITQFRLHQQNHNSFCSALFFFPFRWNSIRKLEAESFVFRLWNVHPVAVLLPQLWERPQIDYGPRTTLKIEIGEKRKKDLTSWSGTWCSGSRHSF